MTFPLFSVVLCRMTDKTAATGVGGSSLAVIKIPSQNVVIQRAVRPVAGKAHHHGRDSFGLIGRVGPGNRCQGTIIPRRRRVVAGVFRCAARQDNIGCVPYPWVAIAGHSGMGESGSDDN